MRYVSVQATTVSPEVMIDDSTAEQREANNLSTLSQH